MRLRKEWELKEIRFGFLVIKQNNEGQTWKGNNFSLIHTSASREASAKSTNFFSKAINWEMEATFKATATFTKLLFDPASAF